MVYNNWGNHNNIYSKYIDKFVEGGTITYISGSGEGELATSDPGTLTITPSVISGLSLYSNSISYEWSRVIKVDTNNNNNLTGNLLVSYPEGRDVYAKLCIYNPRLQFTNLLGINVNVGDVPIEVEPIFDNGLACWEDRESLYPPSYTINGISSNIRLEKLNELQYLFGNLDGDCSSNAINLKMPSRGETGNLKLSILGTTTVGSLSVRIMVEYIIQNINDKYTLNISVSSEQIPD